MKIKPFSLIDDDENSSQTHFSSKNIKYNKDKEDKEDNDIINNKKLVFPGNNIKNLDTAKKENDLKNSNVNSQQKVVNDFRDKINKEKLFQINIKTKMLSQKNNINDNSNPSKDNKEEKDTNYIIKKEENKENKLSKTLLNEKKEKRNSYHGKIYFFIAISMLLYQYLSYIFLIEKPIIESK